MKTKMGRPKLPKGETKGVLIGARFSDDESKKIHGKIKSLRMNKSLWIRERLLAAAA